MATKTAKKKVTVTRGVTRKKNRELLRTMAQRLDADVGLDFNPPNADLPYFYTIGEETTYFRNEASLREALKERMIAEM